MAWLWAAVFVLVGVALYDALLDRMVPPNAAAYREYNLDRIRSFAEDFPKGDATRIVAIGNSRLKYATLDDEQMAGLAESIGAGRFGLLRLVNNSAIFRDFEPLTDALLAIEPDAIVVQLDLMAIGQSRAGQRFLSHEYLTWQLLGYGPWHPRGDSPEVVQYAKPCGRIAPQEHLNTMVKHTRQWIKEDTAATSARQAHAFVDRAVRAGIPVVLVAVPATIEMERVHPSDHGAYLTGAAAIQEMHRSVELLRYPGPVPRERACDAVHMDDVAREQFSRWLITELSRRLGAGRGG